MMARYAMGPHLEKWFSNSQIPEAEDHAGFQNSFLDRLSDRACDSTEQLIDVLEELVGMNFPLLAIKWIDSHLHLWPQGDFRAQLHLGNACMLAGELPRAIECFEAAQSLVPAEPAPYTNLTNILLHLNHLDEARTWCNAGLDVEPNNFNLWKLRYEIEEAQGTPDIRRTIADDAKKRNSWAGVLLSFEITPDSLAKADALTEYVSSYNHDPLFLIEYTSALGQAGRYDLIPPVVWSAENYPGDVTSWQLYLNAAQAEMGMGRPESAAAFLEKASKFQDVPPQARQIITEMKTELTQH
jgi:tetratricopeptide (TPR) repeat protein